MPARPEPLARMVPDQRRGVGIRVLGFTLRAAGAVDRPVPHLARVRPATDFREGASAMARVVRRDLTDRVAGGRMALSRTGARTVHLSEELESNDRGTAPSQSDAPSPLSLAWLGLPRLAHPARDCDAALPARFSAFAFAAARVRADLLAIALGIFPCARLCDDLAVATCRP